MKVEVRMRMRWVMVKITMVRVTVVTGDCGQVENKDEEGDGENNNGEEILGEDFHLCLLCV